MKESKWTLLLGVSILLVLNGCTPPEACSYSGMARAWLDANENGSWDEGEEPLPGIEFSVSGDLDAAQGGISNEKGEAVVGAINMSCGTAFSICAEPAPGYRLTTQRCLGGKFPGGFFEAESRPGELLFGFVPVVEQP
jgi:hypothetical protein